MIEGHKKKFADEAEPECSDLENPSYRWVFFCLSCNNQSALRLLLASALQYLTNSEVIQEMTNTEIESVSQYVAFIETYKADNEHRGNKAELIFRGQPVDKPLLPKIARLNLRLKTNALAKTEQLILGEFRRGILPLAEFNPTNNWDLLALAQHHGLPTRLLDWTYNALAALWFAVEKAPESDKSGNALGGVVFILAGDVNDFRTNTDKVDPLSNKITKIFRSNVISRRISAQTGIFTVHKINSVGKMFKFETHANFKQKLTKLSIPPNRFAIIRRQLDILGINRRLLFPDLDGFCSHLTWRFSKLSDE
jgi:hypothetical protein